MGLKASPGSKRIAWLEGIRIFAAVMILLYHAQLLITNYAYSPQPSGLFDNLGLILSADDRSGLHPWSILSSPFWFGFQFVDVFIIISGFSLVLSLKGQPLNTAVFIKRRFLRILAPFWTVVWLSYPILWLIGTANHSYIPSLWNFFAAATFPLLFDFSGELLLPISGPWWFVSLILSFTLIFPLLWYLLQRWGARNLFTVSLLLTLIYRTLAVYAFGGHPTYVIAHTSADWLPFLPFLSKLSTFVLGMIVAQAYLQGSGPFFWTPGKALQIGVPVYLLGFVSQFYQSGWIVADLLVPVGLTLCSMAIFKSLAAVKPLQPALLRLGAHSYSYFLIHNLVIDRTINLAIHGNGTLYSLLLPVMMVGTLLLAVLVDWVTPVLLHLTAWLWREMDTALTKPAAQDTWCAEVYDRSNGSELHTQLQPPIR